MKTKIIEIDESKSSQVITNMFFEKCITYTYVSHQLVATGYTTFSPQLSLW